MNLNPTSQNARLYTMIAQSSETVLSTLLGTTDRDRLLVVLCLDTASGSRIELRQQSFGEGVGWFTQSSVALEPHQVAELRGVLGTGGNVAGGSARPSGHLPSAYSRISRGGFSPRVVHADSA